MADITMLPVAGAKPWDEGLNQAITNINVELENITGTGIFPDATVTTQGIVELATSAEAIAGSDTDRAVTPAALAAALENFTDSAPGLRHYFQGADSSTVVGDAKGGEPEQQLAGTWGISSKRLVSTGASSAVIVWDAGTADGKFEAGYYQTAQYGGVSREPWIIFRCVDANNLMLLSYSQPPLSSSTTNVYIYKRIAGVYTALAGPVVVATPAVNSRYVLEVRARGNRVEGWLNGTKILFFEGITGLEAATKAGIGSNAGMPQIGVEYLEVTP